MNETVVKAREWLKKNLTTIARIGVIVLFLLLAIWAITLEHYNLVIGYSGLASWLTTALISVAPELAGIVIGVVTIDYLNERRQNEELKAQLTRDLFSNVRDIAVRAIDELREHGWLDEVLGKNRGRFTKVDWRGSDLSFARLDGIFLQYANLEGVDLECADLKGATLSGAKLKGAILRKAYLEEADLDNANLQEADLWEANLERGYMVGANLQKAILLGANLRDANLGLSNLQGAFLGDANLQGAELKGSNLEGADLTNTYLQGAKSLTVFQLGSANCLYGATMPDGVQLYRELLNPNGLTFEEWVISKGLEPFDVIGGEEEE